MRLSLGTTTQPNLPFTHIHTHTETKWPSPNCPTYKMPSPCSKPPAAATNGTPRRFGEPSPAVAAKRLSLLPEPMSKKGTSAHAAVAAALETAQSESELRCSIYGLRTSTSHHLKPKNPLRTKRRIASQPSGPRVRQSASRESSGTVLSWQAELTHFAEAGQPWRNRLAPGEHRTRSLA